ncbi:2,5-diamino-6-(ribosylamino)-4(3H)-pyrimidinone 5'-phosphate reductase [Teratosphaeriaceae sp. CCFEE 6253]|nr:2,5-diamino-6-(ribosylamino)-4(3H)-pyrimidinone 5'-phosphate reductase [Teratosphaeriaceae sp. CCFEE 6253]
MPEVGELPGSDLAFLEPYLPRSGRHNEAFSSNATASDHRDIPFVTLTYASSLDGMISLSPGVRTTLSGAETKSMTHYLRLHHDAILVGVGTAIPDDPSLNCRYLDSTLESQPRPVIVDPKKRWDGGGKTPWLLHLKSAKDANDVDGAFCERLYIADDRKDASGTAATPAMSWPIILQTLKQRGIESVMIEGGATIIATLLGMPELVDSVIVTIAPTWLGEGGVSITPAARVSGTDRLNSATLTKTAWRQFGPDAVLCGRLQARG